MAIEISEKAAVRIRALSTEKGTPAGGLRLGVKGGGCSGLSYFIDWAATPSRLDQVIERDGARVFVERRKARRLEAHYLETKKNKPCLEFWQRSGLTEQDHVFSWEVERGYAC